MPETTTTFEKSIPRLSIARATICVTTPTEHPEQYIQGCRSSLIYFDIGCRNIESDSVMTRPRVRSRHLSDITVVDEDTFKLSEEC
jgi:hypothetical protein